MKLWEAMYRGDAYPYTESCTPGTAGAVYQASRAETSVHWYANIGVKPATDLIMFSIYFEI